ncbi:hypothetical protein RD055328_11600 [Companilactobacillus sp. RD055328]|uniref:hypothetical protein n=1 Tax=Companilactobacillus sp. RD055328 TaxID=2916634 RepID=UPI001FC8BD49|nr:hypothetical protein [Companilactobacillus sp. RD055328]GKQ43237.1 hypothetical protein RD055328_11600 [Companilactobacillus sp. RD055328]
MNFSEISKFASTLYDETDDIVQKNKKLDTKKVYKLIDEISLLRQPIAEYFDMTENEYYQEESDHGLTLQDEKQKMSDLRDRVLLNHVDGSLVNEEINFTYNHETPYDDDGQYLPAEDLHLISFSLQVIGAVSSNTRIGNIRNILSRDALLSVGLAAHAVDEWQNK